MATVQQALSQLQIDLASVQTRRVGDQSLTKLHSDVTALAAAIAALPQTIPAVVVLTPTSGGTATDSNGNVWAVTSSGHITENGKQDPNASNVGQLVQYQGTIYVQSNSGPWYKFTSTGWVSTPGNPIPASTSPGVPPPSPSPIFIHASGGSWTDPSGNVWSIDPGGNVLKGGATTTKQASLGAGINGAFFILGTDMNVYGWGGSDWTIVPYVASTAPVPPVAAPPPPPMASFFVAKTGSDSNPGTVGQPFLTITKGVNSCAAGQSVSVGDGTYTENIIVTANGTAVSPITVFAQNGAGHVTITGTGAVAGSAWTGAVIQPSGWAGDDTGNPTASGNQYIIWQNFTVTTPTAVPNQVLAFRGPTGWQLQGCTIQNIGGGINVRGQNVIITGCTFSNIEGTAAHYIVGAGGDGSSAPKLSGFQQLNNTVNGVNLQGLTAVGNSAVHKLLGSTGAIIKGNTVTNVNGPAFWFDGFGPFNDTFQVSHNTADHCTFAGVLSEGNPTANARIFNNKFTNCGNTGASGQCGGVCVFESQNIEIDHNQFSGGNVQGIAWRNGSHPVLTTNINIHNNWFNDATFNQVNDEGDPNYSTPAGASSTMDFDTFGPNAGPYIAFGSTVANTLAQCVSLYGQEVHGATASSPPSGTGP